MAKKNVCKGCEFNYDGICHNQFNARYIIEGRKELKQIFEVKADKEECKHVRGLA